MARKNKYHMTNREADDLIRSLSGRHFTFVDFLLSLLVLFAPVIIGGALILFLHVLRMVG